MTQSDFVHRGQALVSAGQYQEAVKVCRLGLLGRPTTVDGRVVLGQALLALKRYDEVLAEMRVALELDHSAVPAHALKGEALLRKGDRHAAIETLERAKTIAPEDPQIIRLLTEAERVPGGNQTSGPLSVVPHPSVEFVRSKPIGTPSSLDVEPDSGSDLLVTPPRVQPVPPSFDEPRGQATRSRKDKPTRQARPSGGPASPVVEKAGPLVRQPRGNVRDNNQLVELDSDDLLDDDVPARAEGPGTRVRNLVGMASGPLTSSGAPSPLRAPPSPSQPPPPRAATQAQQPPPPARSPAPMRAPPPPTQPPPPPLAQAISRAPHVIEMTPIAPMPQPPMTIAGQAMPLPAPPPPMMAQPPPPISQQLAQQNVAMPPPIARAPQPPAPTMMVQPPAAAALATDDIPMLDSGVVAIATGAPAALAAPSEGTRDPGRGGARKPRSKLSVVLWILVGASVIGGGVFAGLQIRAMRLGNQIEDAREHATEQAKPDTWAGWTAARDSLANIVQASTALENRAALARVKGLLAYELGDNIGDAKAAVESLKGQPGVDADIAAAYLALAFDDFKTAKQHADAAVDAGGDAEAIYVSGLAQLLGGDYAAGIATVQKSLDADSRALPAANLAHALADTGAYDAALAALDKAFVAYPDNPALIIARVRTLAVAGRIAPGAASADLRATLGHVIDEAGKPVAEQPRGVSPAQLAFATLAEVRIEYARGNQTAERAALRQLVAVAIDDQRFAEETIDTLAAVGEIASAKSAADRALAIWPQSRLATIALAQLQIAASQPSQALDTLKKVADATTLPSGLVARADARAAAGDLDGARADYDTTLKRLPGYERAVLGRVAMDLKANDVAGARALVDKATAGPSAPSPAIAVAFVAVVRAGAADTIAAGLDKAKTALDKAIAAAPSSPDVTRAQLELARIDRDQGNLRAARDLFAEAARAGSVDAKLESARLAAESDPVGGRDALEQLVKELAGGAPPAILVELGHARMVVGDHDGAEAALDAADRAFASAGGGAPAKWPLDRERARLALRRGDLAAAAAAIDRAVDACGPDADTLLLAADIVSTDAEIAEDTKAPPKLGELEAKLRKQTTVRMSGRPEAQLVVGTLALGADHAAEAQAAFDAASTQLGKQAPPRLEARVLYGLAVLAYRANNAADARNKLEAVIAVDPTNYNAYLYEIDLALRDKELPAQQLASVLEAAKTVVRIDPANVYGWYYLGVLGQKAGQGKLLADAIAMVSQLAPTSDLVHQLQTLKK